MQSAYPQWHSESRRIMLPQQSLGSATYHRLAILSVLPNGVAEGLLLVLGSSSGDHRRGHLRRQHIIMMRAISANFSTKRGRRQYKQDLLRARANRLGKSHDGLDRDTPSRSVCGTVPLSFLQVLRTTHGTDNYTDSYYW